MSTLHWESTGTGDPVLMIMGLGLSGGAWWRTVPVLSRSLRVITFDNRGVGRSRAHLHSYTTEAMADDAVSVLDAAGIERAHVYGFSLGGMVAQQMVRDRPTIFRRMVLVGTAPRGGDDIMHLEKPVLAGPLNDPSLAGYTVLQKIFFTPTASSQAAGSAFVNRLLQRTEDLDNASGPAVAAAQMAAFREWEHFTGLRFADLHGIQQPTLVVNGIHDEMIPVSNSYRLSEHLPNAVLLTYPDSGHGSLFQFHESFTRQAAAFLASDSPYAPY
jgi:pimeloyl-ACP methyl ester carboxylesterase